MANLQDLKKMMNSVPDHKMRHDKPIRGPIREKKHGMAGRMSGAKVVLGKPRRLTESEQAEKSKDWPKGGSPVGNREMSKDYGTGRNARFN